MIFMGILKIVILDSEQYMYNTYKKTCNYITQLRFSGDNTYCLGIDGIANTGHPVNCQ